MSLHASVSPNDSDELQVEIPPTRPDILHECDIMEDAAIAYGFNNLPDTFPTTSTVAQPLAISKLSDVVRTEWALAGWVEVLPLILVRAINYRLADLLSKYCDSAHTKKISNG
jgi:phenylalanyl-tRNA synthetase beta chain